MFPVDARGYQGCQGGESISSQYVSVTKGHQFSSVGTLLDLLPSTDSHLWRSSRWICDTRHASPFAHTVGDRWIQNALNVFDIPFLRHWRVLQIQRLAFHDQRPDLFSSHPFSFCCAIKELMTTKAPGFVVGGQRDYIEARRHELARLGKRGSANENKHDRVS
jgi:hypothetical protein